MSKKESTEPKGAESAQPSPFEVGAMLAKQNKPIEMGVKHFDSIPGNSIEGYFMGVGKVDKKEMTDEAIPDNRRSTIETAYIRVSPYLVMRTGNASAVQHFMGLPAGSYVRLTCTEKAQAGERAAQFRLELLASSEQVAEALGGDITELISGLLN